MKARKKFKSAPAKTHSRALLLLDGWNAALPSAVTGLWKPTRLPATRTAPGRDPASKNRLSPVTVPLDDQCQRFHRTRYTRPVLLTDDTGGIGPSENPGGHGGRA